MLKTKFFSPTVSGYQQVRLHEGTAPIWISTRNVHVKEYYILCLYWSAQVVGTLGFGDINATSNEDLVCSIVALFFAVLFRVTLMGR